METDKLLDSLRNNKKTVILVIIGITVLFTILFFIGRFVNNYFDKKNLEKALTSMGEKVYKELYYKDLKDDFAVYEKEGIKITLNDMFNATDLDYKDYFYNRKTKKVCDSNTTYIIIYPKSPYRNSDYDLTFNLECGY